MQDNVKKTKLGAELGELEKDVKKADSVLYEQVEVVELQKVKDVREMCIEYLHTSIMYHARCLENLTATSVMFENIQDEKEVEVKIFSVT